MTSPLRRFYFECEATTHDAKQCYFWSRRRLTMLKSHRTYELCLTRKHKLFLMLLSFQTCIARTPHLKPRWPRRIISNELSVSFPLFLVWLLFDRSSTGNRWPIWPFPCLELSTVMDEKGGTGSAFDVCRKSEDRLLAGTRRISFASWTVRAQRGWRRFIQPKTNPCTIPEKNERDLQDLLSANGHDSSWREDRKKVVTSYPGPREVTSYLPANTCLEMFVLYGRPRQRPH